MKTQAFCRILWYSICMENREMQTSNTAEMVTISRAEYERFQVQAQTNVVAAMEIDVIGSSANASILL